MTTAFDWSPGGCCCGPKEGWFDSYTYRSGTDFQREAFAMLPLGKTRQYGSKAGVGWSIQLPAGKTLNDLSGFTANGERVWGVASYVGGTSDFFCYDAPAGARRFGIVPPSGLVSPAMFVPNNQLGQVAGFGSIGADVYATRASGGSAPLQIIDSNGAIAAWPALPPDKYIMVPGSQVAFTMRETVMGVAPLDWPKAIMVREVIENGFQFNEFIIGDLTYTATELTLTNRQVIKRVQLTTATSAVKIPNPIQPRTTYAKFLGFDHFNGHWAAVILYQDDWLSFPQTPGKTHYEVIIDGQSIIHHIDQPFAQNATQVHVCYPHESLGAGYVMFQGLPTGPNFASRLTCAKSTGVQWTRPLSTAELFGSTDRWVYFRHTEGRTVAEMTDGKFVRIPDIPGAGISPAQNYIVRHDNSEIMPMGQLHANKFQMVPGIGMGTPVNTFMRDSQALPGPLPASYEEMWEQRNG